MTEIIESLDCRDGITNLLKPGGKPVLKALQKLFNFVILEEKTPQVISGVVEVLFKNINALLKSYRPIPLLSHVYKLFSRVITNHLAGFDDFQPPEQSGFRKGFSTVDLIHTLQQVILNTEEPAPMLSVCGLGESLCSIESWAQGCTTAFRSAPD